MDAINIDPLKLYKEAAPLLVAAYMGIWVVFFIYLFILQGKIRGLKKQVEVLSKAIEKKPAKKKAETANV